MNNAVWITMCLIVVVIINMFGAGNVTECIVNRNDTNTFHPSFQVCMVNASLYLRASKLLP